MFFTFNDFCQVTYLKIYWTDLCQIFTVGNGIYLDVNYGSLLMITIIHLCLICKKVTRLYRGRRKNSNAACIKDRLVSADRNGPDLQNIL